MTASSLITDYINVGLAASRPATPSLATGAFGFYYATDTNVLSVWTGSAWVNLSSSAPAMTSLGTVTTAGSQTSVTFASISGSYTHLRIIGAARSATSAASDNIRIQFNSDTTNTNYSSQQLQGASSAASAAANPGSFNNLMADVAAATATANQCGTFDVTIPMYAATTFIKSWHSNNGVPGFPLNKIVAGRWNVTTAISRIDLVLSSGAAFVNGSVFSLYGLN